MIFNFIFIINEEYNKIYMETINKKYNLGLLDNEKMINS